jgi:hypothetical protein
LEFAGRRKKDTMTGILQLLNSRSHRRGLHIKARHGSSRHLRIEALEQRAMLTTTATHFEVIVPSSIMPGVAFDVTVKAIDASNNVVDGYTGTVHFSSTDVTAMVPADTTQTTGTGTYSAAFNTPGNWTITVMDAANNIMGTSNSVAVATTAATTTTVTATPNPSAVGQAVKFTATVSSDPASGTPTGSVQFLIDGANFGSAVALGAGGVATITDSALSVGTHTVTAVYSGDSAHSASTSDPLTQTVLSVEQQVQNLKDQIATLGLNKGNTNSLDVKLNLKGNHGDIGKVGAFIHEVKALTKAHKISQANADMLISEADGLLISLRFVESTAAATHGNGHGNGQAKHHA